MAKVLIVDDDQATGDILQTIVLKIGHRADYRRSLSAGLEAVGDRAYDVVFLDVKLPDGNGLQYIESFQRSRGEPEVIIITGVSTGDGAELAIRSGAWDYLQKPLSPREILLPVTRVLEYRENLKKSTAQPKVLKRDGIIGSSKPLEHALQRLAQAAGNRSNVLIVGETGTGKEVFARTLHQNSARAAARLVVVDCASLPENLIESTLFGHVRGAFTSADRSVDGLVKLADGGTLFLDEIGELGLGLQKTLLRVIQEKTFRPLGGSKELYSDFRLVAATNRDLETLVSQGGFREDLLFRLKSHVVSIPPLRDRSEDIELLVVHYSAELAHKMGLGRKGFSPDFIEALQQYQWPGNVRELIHTVEQALINAADEPIIFPIHLPKSLRIKIIDSRLSSAVADWERSAEEGVPIDEMEPAGMLDSDSLPDYKVFRREALDRLEKRYLERLLTVSGGQLKEAKEIAGIGRTHLYNLLKKHNLST